MTTKFYGQVRKKGKGREKDKGGEKTTNCSSTKYTLSPKLRNNLATPTASLSLQNTLRDLNSANVSEGSVLILQNATYALNSSHVSVGSVPLMV
jgi:hypothetical protein